VRASQVSSSAHLLCWLNGEKWLTLIYLYWGPVMTDLSNKEMVRLFKQHLEGLREGCDAVSEHITASQETIKQSRALLVQLDEQINQMERELGWFGGRLQAHSLS
jgi:hypothetical protein